MKQIKCYNKKDSKDYTLYDFIQWCAFPDGNITALVSDIKTGEIKHLVQSLYPLAFANEAEDPNLKKYLEGFMKWANEYGGTRVSGISKRDINYYVEYLKEETK